MGNSSSAVPKPSNPDETGAGTCPVKPEYRNANVYNVYGQRINDPSAAPSKNPLTALRSSEILDPRNNMPLEPNQLPCPGQRKPLTTERVPSCIPKGGTAGTWVFPSPQMVFNGTDAEAMHATSCMPICGHQNRTVPSMHDVLMPLHPRLSACAVDDVEGGTVRLRGMCTHQPPPHCTAALRRKGKGGDVTEDDMEPFVTAHNGRSGRF